MSVQSSTSSPLFTAIRCGLYNSSYLVKANFIDGQQEISYTTTRLDGLSPRIGLPCDLWYPDTCVVESAYLSIFDALGKTLIGTLSDNDLSSIKTARTQILTTVLSQSWEFRLLPQILQGPISIANMSLAEALEQSVANTTLSLLSDSYFLRVPILVHLTKVVSHIWLISIKRAPESNYENRSVR
jgi:hypothetical protein